MLSLREIIEQSNSGDSRDDSDPFSSIGTFAAGVGSFSQNAHSIVGPMGAPLDHSALWNIPPLGIAEDMQKNEHSVIQLDDLAHIL